MVSEALSAAEERFETLSSSHKAFALPVLKAIESLGGVASPSEAKKVAWDLIGDRLSEGQRSYLKKNGRLAWTRYALKERGFLEGKTGEWRLTDQALRFLDAHRDDPIEMPAGIPDHIEKRQEEDSTGIEKVTVTSQPAYYIPILGVLSHGVRTRADLLVEVKQAIGDRLLEGDLRKTKSGYPVWRHRTGWALTALKSKGWIRNVGSGRWEITESGRTHYGKEKDSWSGELPTGTAQVLRFAEGGDTPPEPDETPEWSSGRWNACRAQIGQEIFTAVGRRIRPELGPDCSSAIPRNLIFYGPPGTGKTWIARQVAMALTGQSEPGPESLWRLVQFHPSYAYEDFIQGLRPDLEKEELTYKLATGPFLELCQAASEDSDRYYVLVIDEINRGDPARIFGELLYALEYRDEPVDLALGGQLTVPKNVVILGTMNSVDRSVALVDYALRRRFGFVRVSPDPELVAALRSDEAAAALSARALHYMNRWLAEELDGEHTLGHSFFLNQSIPLDSEKALDSIWLLDIKPLLEEYFFGDAERLKAAESQWKSALARSAADADDANDEAGPE